MEVSRGCCPYWTRHPNFDPTALWREAVHARMEPGSVRVRAVRSFCVIPWSGVELLLGC